MCICVLIGQQSIMFFVLVFLQMACVAPSYHGGDAGGDPPEDRQPKRLPYLCEGQILWIIL